jgi:hypothetical protein
MHAREKALKIAAQNQDYYNDYGEFFPNERQVALMVKAIEAGVKSVEITYGYGPFGRETRAVIDGQRVSDIEYARAAKAVCDFDAGNHEE